MRAPPRRDRSIEDTPTARRQFMKIAGGVAVAAHWGIGSTAYAQTSPEGQEFTPDRSPLTSRFARLANFATGPNALAANTSGTNNFAWGLNALAANGAGSGNIAFGNNALRSNTGDTKVATGTFGCKGWNNIAVGDSALRDNRLGYENLAIGQLSLAGNVLGKWNLAIGHNSQILGTISDCNISLGAYTLTKAMSSNNLAIGWAALEVAITGSNCAVGHSSQNASVTAARNTSLGPLTLLLNQKGNDNVAIGQETLKNLKEGSQNTACGAFALGQTNQAVLNNSAFGFNALLSLTKANACTAVGAGALAANRTYDNCTGIGANSAVSGHDQVQLGGPGTTPYAYAPLQLRSDRRDKTDIRDTMLGLEFIKALRPRDFRWDMRDDYRTSPPTPPLVDHPNRGDPDYSRKAAAYQAAQAAHANELAEWTRCNALGKLEPDGTHKRSRYHQGLIAQEVKAAMESLGVDCSAYQDHSITGGDDVLSIGYDGLIAPLIKAVQQLATENSLLSERIAALEANRA